MWEKNLKTRIPGHAPILPGCFSNGRTVKKLSNIVKPFSYIW